MKRYKASDFGMNPYSDTVGTSEEWASEAHLWMSSRGVIADDEEVEKQFDWLIEVVPDGQGGYKEV